MRERHVGGLVGWGLAAALFAAPAGAEHHLRFTWSGDVGIGYDDNVGNAGPQADIRDDTFASAGLNLDFNWRPTLFTGLLLRSSLRADGFADTDGLSNAKLVEMVRLTHRAGGGFYAPTFAVWASAGLWEFDSAMRDGVEYRAGAYVAEPISTAISARLGVSVAERDSASYVFDLGSWSANLDLDWQVAPALTVYAGYQLHDGDIVSTGSTPPKSSHIPGGGGGSTAADPDDALYGLFAYRVDATTHVGTLGLNLALSPRFALDAQLRRVDSETDGGSRYDRWIGVVSALSRF